MSLPIILPIPIFFLIIIIKVILLLIIPFALELIVRLQAQAAHKWMVKIDQNFGQTPPVDPSPSPDGEDKPEDSYWKRFKRWCSDHSLAIGLGIGLISATLIYIYRKDISELIYGNDDQPSEGKKRKAGYLPPIPEKEPLLGIQPESPIPEEYDFSHKGETITPEEYMQKALAFSEKYKEIFYYVEYSQYFFYYSKIQEIEKTERLTFNLLLIQDKFSVIAQLSALPEEDVQKFATAIKANFERKTSEKSSFFKNFLEFITADPAAPRKNNLNYAWETLVTFYLRYKDVPRDY